MGEPISRIFNRKERSMDIGARILELRRKKGLKQTDLANALQLSPQAVSKWEKNHNAPDLAVLPRLAKLFSVTVDSLLGMNEDTPGVFEATVFSSSIRGFAQKALSANSKELAERTNVTFHHLTEAVLRFGGVPVKYVGDGFLCFFSGVGHTDRALSAAIYAKKILEDKTLMIVLNAGDIYLGSIGHPDYASRDICGDVVNRVFLIAPWVSEECAGGIGLTEAVRQGLQKKALFRKPRQVSIPLLKTQVTMYEPASSLKT